MGTWIFQIYIYRYIYIDGTDFTHLQDPGIGSWDLFTLNFSDMLLDPPKEIGQFDGERYAKDVKVISVHVKSQYDLLRSFQISHHPKQCFCSKEILSSLSFFSPNMSSTQESSFNSSPSPSVDRNTWISNSFLILLMLQKNPIPNHLKWILLKPVWKNHGMSIYHSLNWLSGNPGFLVAHQRCILQSSTSSRTLAVSLFGTNTLQLSQVSMTLEKMRLGCKLGEISPYLRD